MLKRIIEWSVANRLLVLLFTAAAIAGGIWAIRNTPLEALPDLSDVQVIVQTDFNEQAPRIVEDQVTYPIAAEMLKVPAAKVVRGYSMFGMSFVYVIFDDGTDLYWARTRVVEQMARVARLLPEGVAPVLGPDATGVGWIYQYALVDSSGRLDLAQLRELQDFTVRPALQAVPGIAEVASLGGFERQYQVSIDPNRLAAYGLSLGDVSRSVQAANSEVGARVVELAGREYVLRGRGYVGELADLEESVVRTAAGGTPVRLRDVATVQ